METPGLLSPSLPQEEATVGPQEDTPLGSLPSVSDVVSDGGQLGPSEGKGT